MNQSFKNILVPVDFSCNTEMAIKKAIQLADVNETVVHLLHVTKPEKENELFTVEISDTNSKHFGQFDNGEILKMIEWKGIINKMIPDVAVKLYMVQGKSLEEMIIQKSRQVLADLIIIAKHSNRKWVSFGKAFSPTNIALRTRSAVLTVKQGALRRSIKSIVLPIHLLIPKRKVDMLFPLVSKRPATIYLLSVLQTSGDDIEYSSVSHALIETYRILKDEANCQIVHKMVTGHNMAKAILHFAESVDADLLMLNPEESKIRSFTGSLDFIDLVGRNSKLQIMEVNSYNSDP